MYSFPVSLAQISGKPIVKVQQGLLKGKLLKSVGSKNNFAAFLGIPYAKPPVGNLKFKVMRETGSMIRLWESSKHILKCQGM
jgi:carboxylesterase type B